ncbi:MAG: SHOCT domain-containing protein [Bacteroidales bacterium]|nr:SHOCT domain-containing protein [Bacteroidales bacterium]
MKKLMIFLLMLVFVVPAFSQKKGKVDPEKVTIDSLTNVNQLLSGQLDSITAERETYFGVYSAVKDKVIKYDFNPENASDVLDSLAKSMDATALLLSSTKDSLTAIQLTYKEISAKLDNLNAADSDKAKLVEELKQLKELLDAKIITQDDFDKKKNLLMEKWE